MNYNIEGEPLPVVICNLEANETMITEKGAMSWMTPNMKMETTSNGGIGKMFGRAFSGESMFQNRYTSMGGPGMIAFASCFPGCIRPFQIAPGQEIIAQKSAFLASTSGVELSVFFQKRRLNHKFCGISDSSRSSVGSYRIASERNIRHQDIRIPVCEES